MIEISFKTEKDRIKGIATLLRSEYAFKGLDKNRFLIESQALEIIQDLIDRKIMIEKIAEKAINQNPIIYDRLAEI